MADALAIGCLACGGELSFDPATGKLVCEYCGSSFTNEEIDAAYKEKQEKAEAKGDGEITGEDDPENAGMHAFTCSTCGAELLTDGNTGASTCPYCGNNTIMPAQFTGNFKPDHVIPFKFKKEQAVAKYKEYYQKRKLIPKDFVASNKVEEIQGVYVPFWLFDGTIGIRGLYEAKDKYDRGEYIEIKEYRVLREGTVDFRNVPADASKRMDDALMDSIEPYNFAELKDFSMSYLPGFLAEKFDVEDKDDIDRIEKRLKNTADEKARATIKHNSVSAENLDFKIEYSGRHYALLPVWMLTTNWQSNKYTFAMNGQTGKFIGDLPVDKGKLTALVAVIFIIAFIIGMILFGHDENGDTTLMMPIIIGVVAAAIGGGAAYGSMKPVAIKHEAREYMDSINITSAQDDYIRTVRQQKQRNGQ
ncbi:MAG: TFIIB-type zinc ribbon-containing protein [Oscillospiraceae bacterium]|nr:TFIIB-type zinc ribbon-containing protein [Oscillospiraceae bacterium]